MIQAISGSVNTARSRPSARALRKAGTSSPRTVGYLGNIISGREKPDQLGGPIRVAKYSKDMSTLGIAALIQLAAVLSVSIGLLNLMPVPMLDGGHLVFLRH